MLLIVHAHLITFNDTNVDYLEVQVTKKFESLKGI